MFPQSFHAVHGKKMFVKLAWLMGIVGVATIVASSPLLAQGRYRFSLLQPIAAYAVPYRSSNTSIADTLAKDPKYANLVDELKEAGLFNMLKQPGYYTIFAPTDFAFNSLPKGTFQQYSQPNNRVKVLRYHVVAGKLTPEQLNSGVIKTIEGNEVRLTDVKGKIKVNDADIKQPSITTTNGVIVEIDKLLQPSGVKL